MLWPEATKILLRIKLECHLTRKDSRKERRGGRETAQQKVELELQLPVCRHTHSHSLGTATTTLQRHHGHFVRRSTLQTQSVCSAIATVDRTEPRLDNYFVRETDDKATYELKSSVNINMAPPKRAAMLAYATAVALHSAHARTWWGIEIPAIDGIHDSDPLLSVSSQLSMEDMSFLYGSLAATDGIKSSPNAKPVTFSIPAPSSHPTASIQLVSSTVTNAPTAQSDVPTWSPSSLYQAVNGSCPSGETLHRLFLFDSYGDGWGTAQLGINESESTNTVFAGSLDGTSVVTSDNSAAKAGGGEGAVVYLCLKPDVCYTAEVTGGIFLEEISWEIQKVELRTGRDAGVIAKGFGGGFGGCQFRLEGGDGRCVTTCDGECVDCMVYVDLDSIFRLFLTISCKYICCSKARQQKMS
jgi:hypothetical protein